MHTSTKSHIWNYSLTMQFPSYESDGALSPSSPKCSVHGAGCSWVHTDVGGDDIQPVALLCRCSRVWPRLSHLWSFEGHSRMSTAHN